MATWDLGDLVPLQLVVPTGDGTTSATVTYTSPTNAQGTVTPPLSDDGGKTWKTNWLLNVAGIWTFVWTVTGAGAGKQPFTVDAVDWTVTPPVSWSPGLRDVADLVPQRTLPVDNSTDTPLMIFDLTTVPTGEQVSRILLAATRWVTLACGPVNPLLYNQAMDVATLRAAGMVELSYPIRDDDINTGQTWLDQADVALANLRLANAATTGSTETDVYPVFAFPDPHITEKYHGWRIQDI